MLPGPRGVTLKCNNLQHKWKQKPLLPPPRHISSLLLLLLCHLSPFLPPQSLSTPSLHGGSSNLILSPSGRRNEGGPGLRCPAAMARWSRRLAGRLGRDEWRGVGEPAEWVSRAQLISHVPRRDRGQGQPHTEGTVDGVWSVDCRGQKTGGWVWHSFTFPGILLTPPSKTTFNEWNRKITFILKTAKTIKLHQSVRGSQRSQDGHNANLNSNVFEGRFVLLINAAAARKSKEVNHVKKSMWLWHRKFWTYMYSRASRCG